MVEVWNIFAMPNSIFSRLEVSICSVPWISIISHTLSMPQQLSNQLLKFA